MRWMAPESCVCPLVANEYVPTGRGTNGLAPAMEPAVVFPPDVGPALPVVVLPREGGVESAGSVVPPATGPDDSGAGICDARFASVEPPQAVITTGKTKPRIAAALERGDLIRSGAPR